MGDDIGVIHGHTWSLNYSSHGLHCCDGMVQVLNYCCCLLILLILYDLYDSYSLKCLRIAIPCHANLHGSCCDLLSILHGP